MNFLADESVDRQIVERLRQDGHLVQYVAEMKPGISDDTILASAVPLSFSPDSDVLSPQGDQAIPRIYVLGADSNPVASATGFA